MRKSQSALILWLTLMIIYSISAQTNSSLSVYGVRWFLGDHFTYSINDNTDNTEYFVLMFNSDSGFEGELNVLINKNRFACTTSRLDTKELTIHHPQLNSTNSTSDEGNDDVVDVTYLHKCIIGNLREIVNQPRIKAVNYTIVLDNLYITQTANANIDKYSHTTLFSGIYRLPYYEQTFQALIIGDWGQITSIGQRKGYIDILSCTIKKIEDNPNITMLIFTGDIAYDLQGPKYFSMLKYMQPITSKLTFLAAPGNHDTLYHDDTFLLYTASFYTPQWRNYFNYFNKIKIGKLLFVSYNPELQAYDFNKTDRLKMNLTDIFQKQFTPEVIESIKSQYFPIVFSHYPIYCSNIYDDAYSCQKNEERFKSYREYFNKIDMKLYISGHLHLYERTYPICFNDSFLEGNGNIFGMTCPTYIIEGAGGNDRYVQTEQNYPQRNYSKKIVYNTGFGILTVNSNSEFSYPEKVSYQHISANMCKAVDQFQMIKSAAQTSQPIDEADPGSRVSYFRRIILKIGILSIIIVVIVILFLLVKKKYRSKNPLIKTDNNINQDNHVEMVEQNFEAPQSDKAEPNTF